MAKEFTDSEMDNLLAQESLIVIDFWAEWCGPCRMVGPSIEELSKEYAGKVEIGKLNVDDNVETPSEYGIRNIPTLLFIKDGKIVDKQIGAAPKSVLEAKVQSLL